jgi:hypothetical protein
MRGAIKRNNRAARPLESDRNEFRLHKNSDILSQLIDSIFTLYLKLSERYHYCWHLLSQHLAGLDTNINLLWRKYMFTARTGRLVRKFFISGALVVSIAAPTRLNEAAVQLPCCQSCLNTYRVCLTGCGNDITCKQRCYNTYFACISSCGVESKSTNGKQLRLICPL